MTLLPVVRRLFALLAPYPAVVPAVTVLGVMASLAEGVGIGLMIPFLSSLTGNGPGGGGTIVAWLDAYAAFFPPGARLAVVGGSIAALILLSCLISYAYLSVISWAASQSSHDLRVQLFARFLDDDRLFLEQGAQGRRIKAIDGAAFRAGQATISLNLLIANVCTAAVVLVLLVLISWRMTAMVLVGVALAGLVVRVFVQRGLLVSRRFEDAGSVLSELSVNVLSGLRTVRIFGQERREYERFRAVSESVRVDQLELERTRRSMGPLIDGLTAPMLIGAMVAATYAGVSVVVLLPFLLLVFRLQRYVRESDVMRVHIAADAGAVMEVAALLEEADAGRGIRGEAGGTEDDLPFERLRRGIVLDRVSFHHPGAGDARPSVQELSLDIPHGQTLGIVGGSGAGKSTLINLLCGVHVPTSGAIRIDGRDLATIAPGRWRARLGLAGQDADLRPGTIFENIAYAVPDASREAVRRAAAMASAEAFIEALPMGYDTPVGVRGMQLSGGERQRIALARALLREPDVLILDEATNAVDNLTEASIGRTLAALGGSLTMIVIAHRLSSVRHVDRIVVMEGGRIVERGRPEELALRGGAFAELSRLDAGEPAGAPVGGPTALPPREPPNDDPPGAGNREHRHR